MIEPTDTKSIYNIADWIELKVIYANRSFSKSRIFSLLRGYDDNIKEETIDSAMNELIRRSELYGNGSPFIVERKSIIPKVRWSEKPELTMCLIFSIRGVVKKKGEDDGTKLFERLSREAVKSYLGGEAEVIGAPNKKRLKDQIDTLAMKMCEEKGHRCPPPKKKDRGVDIIAWKPHGDMRPNQIILLLQSGAGRNFKTKKSISIPAWREYVHWLADPICGIAIPLIPSEEDWREHSHDYTLIFDRVRIYKAIHQKRFSDNSLKKQIFNWCKGRLT
jgi:hypothetical protein